MVRMNKYETERNVLMVFFVTQDHATLQIDGLRRQIRKQDKKQQVRMQEVKDLIREQLKDQATKQMK